MHDDLPEYVDLSDGSTDAVCSGSSLLEHLAWWGAVSIAAGLILGAFAAALSGCTLHVDVPPPNVTVKCVEIVLPGGQSSTACPDAGGDASEEAP